MDSPQVRIYSKENIPRLNYIAGIILGDIMGISWDIVTDKRKFGKHFIINYSTETIKDSFNISPDSLLFEKGVKMREIVVTQWRNLPVFFNSTPDCDLPFDIFAASFFLITRYEEYLDFKPDEFGRFPASSSVAFKNGFLDIPIIDFWVREMEKVILKRFRRLVFKRNEYRSMVTIDADQPFAYLGKGLLRSIGGLIRDIGNNDGHASDRYKTVAKGEKDPYQVFDYIIEKIVQYKTDARFFFPVGDHSQYDKNPSWKNAVYRKLIHYLSERFVTGLHPSFCAAGSLNMIQNEKDHLAAILQKDILISRFHYIRLYIPQSYRDIIKTGIEEDYSMGYPDEPGFRAGIARPFFFYDVIKDMKTSLKIVPFQIMDATLYKYKNLSPEASKELISRLICETRKAEGLFVSIWHNTSLLDSSEWHEWRGVFESMLKNQEL